MKKISKIWIGTFHKRYTNSPRWHLPEGTPILFFYFIFFFMKIISIFSRSGMFRFPSFIDARIWNCILLFQVAIRISQKDLSSVSGEYSKKISEKSFDIFGTIKTIGLRERIHSHDQSKREVFSRTVSYKEEIHFIKVVPLPICFFKKK